MDTKQIAKIKKKIVSLKAKRTRLSTAETKRHQAHFENDRKMDREISDLRKQIVTLVCPFKIGDLVKSLNPLGLFEIVSIEPKCYAEDPMQFQLGGLKLTKTGNWGFCSTRKVLNPEYCKPWAPDPLKEPKKKES